MILIEGKYNSAAVYAKELDSSAEGQIKALCNQPFSAGSRIAVMPDVHAGKGCTIGTTMTIDKYVVPCLVGVDIGCGMLTVRLREKRINLPALDSFIRQNIPHGRDIRKRIHKGHVRIDLEGLRCYDRIDTHSAKESLGTLGGGNHFIEVDRDDEGNLYLVIHTGSRNPGSEWRNFIRKKPTNQWVGENKRKFPMNFLLLPATIKTTIFPT